MKCTRLSDWYEEHPDDMPSFDKEKEAVLTHARTCPDCLLAGQGRAILLEILQELPRPIPPSNLPMQIIQNLDMEFEEMENSESQTTDILDIFLERWLQPIQIVLLAACFLTFLSIVLSRDVGKRNEQYKCTGFSRRVATSQVTHESLKNSVKFEHNRPLVRLSDDEIAVFMHKLEDYKRTQVDINTVIPSLPHGMLVKDRN